MWRLSCFSTYAENVSVNGSVNSITFVVFSCRVKFGMCRIMRFRITKDSHQADFYFFLGQLVFHQSCYQKKL